MWRGMMRCIILRSSRMGRRRRRIFRLSVGRRGRSRTSSDNENNLIATNGPETTAVPTKITIEGVLIHEFTKVGSAHVDCLQIWAGNELLISGNTFKRCSVFDIFLQSLPNGSAGDAAERDDPEQLFGKDDRRVLFGVPADITKATRSISKTLISATTRRRRRSRLIRGRNTRGT